MKATVSGWVHYLESKNHDWTKHDGCFCSESDHMKNKPWENHRKMVGYWDLIGFIGIYPLVIYRSYGKWPLIDIYSGFSHYELYFFIGMLIYQKVFVLEGGLPLQRSWYATSIPLWFLSIYRTNHGDTFRLVYTDIIHVHIIKNHELLGNILK